MHITKMIAGITAALVTTVAAAQYDSQTLVDTNNTSTSTSTVTSTNTNTNTNTNNNVNDTTVNSTATNTNTNINTSTSTNNNNNVNTNTSTSTNTNTNTSTSTNVNTNNNINSGEQTFNNNNVNTTNSNNVNTSTVTSTNTNVNSTTSDNTNRNINSGEQTFNNNNTVNATSNNNNVNTSTSENRNENVNRNENTTRIEQPPPTAIAPSMMSGGNNDLCTTGTSGAVQTQILGVSSGGTVRDLNCERLKNAKTLYDMGMKVAAVSVMCQDRRVFDAMWNAGTPCPFEGMIGEAAKLAWESHPNKIPALEEKPTDDFYKKTAFGAFLGALLFGIF